MPRKVSASGEIPVDSDRIVYEEFYDGTNVNVFYYNGTWHISTRSSIGGNIVSIQRKHFVSCFLKHFILNWSNKIKILCIVLSSCALIIVLFVLSRKPSSIGGKYIEDSLMMELLLTFLLQK